MAAGVLALVAALACSLLPGGFLPKTAGPCGRDLCNCAPEPEDICRSCQWHPEGVPSSVRVVSFDNAIITAPEMPGVALQVVFSGVVAPARVQISAALAELELHSPAGSFFALTDTYSDILTPPPRA